MGRVGAEKLLDAEGEGVGNEGEAISVSPRGSGGRGETIGLGRVGSSGGDDGGFGTRILCDGIVGRRGAGDGDRVELWGGEPIFGQAD